MKNFSQNVSTHLEKIGKIFSCKTSCKVDDLFEDINKENKKPSNAQKHYCNKHIKPLSFYCRTCKLFLCVLCCSEHSSLYSKKSHEYIELQNMDNFVEKEIDYLKNEAFSITEQLNNQAKLQMLPDYQREFEEGLGLIEILKKDAIEMVEKHFNSLSEDYLNLFKSLPCKFQKDALELAMVNFIEKIGKIPLNLQKPAKEHKLKNIYDFIPIVKQFNELDNHNNLDILRKSLDILMNFPNSSSKKAVLPKISINPLFSMENSLNDWVSLIGPTENPYDQLKKIRLSLDDYFGTQFENYLVRIDSFNEQLILYNISTHNQEKVCLATEKEIPNNHEIIVTPSLDILIVGGKFKTGEISNDLFYCSPMSSTDYEGNDLPLIQKSNMNVSRLGHSLCFVDGTLFCFGGRNSEGNRINSCEKYEILEDKWEMIAPMNYDRSEFGVSNFNNSFIFAFFGCEHDFFEKYDIQQNKWEVIKPINYDQSLRANNMGCIQVNPNQILLLGGVYEIEKDDEIKGQKMKERKGLGRGLLYNVGENNLINLGEVSPVVLMNPSQMIISNKSIYCLGSNEKDKDCKYNLDQEFEWVYRMKNGKTFDVIDMFYLNKRETIP